jgi:hypothetical protein
LKVLHIAGTIAADLAYVQDIFVNAGMGVQMPLQRNKTLTLDFWHQQVLDRIKDSASRPLELGKVWEQLAGDLFIANLSQPVWGWSSLVSLPILEFWKSFDSQIRFVLIACSAQRYIAHALEAEAQMPSATDLLQRWEEAHLDMLQFHQGNLRKSLIIDIDSFIESTSGHVAVCDKRWKLGLDKVNFFSIKPLHDYSTLTQFLSTELINKDSRLQSVRDRLLSFDISLGRSWNDASVNGIDEAISVYREDRKQQAVDSQLTLSYLSDLQAKCDVLSKELDLARAEPELLLMELHRVQSDLETYFKKIEAFKPRLELAEQRWKQVLQTFPGYCFFHDVNVNSIPGTPNEILNWHFEMFDAVGRIIPNFTLQTFVINDVACLKLPRYFGSVALLERWPLCFANQDELIVTLFSVTKIEQDSAQVLMQLGSSDWDFLVSIVTALIKATETQSLRQRSDGVTMKKTPMALRKLRSHLAQLPVVFRFDHLALKKELVNSDYECLWIACRNVTFGEKRLGEFDFRVSCAHVLPDIFGQYPKLEFPELSGREALDGWFSESCDDLGSKLELRFAKPASMDISVWEKLTPLDRIFVRDLVKQLPSLLHFLECSSHKIQRRWSDWQALVSSIDNILETNAPALTNRVNIYPD